VLVDVVHQPNSEQIATLYHNSMPFDSLTKGSILLLLKVFTHFTAHVGCRWVSLQEGEGMNAGAGLPLLLCTKNESVPIRQFLSVEFV
jgi:hypothetical protein